MQTLMKSKLYLPLCVFSIAEGHRHSIFGRQTRWPIWKIHWWIWSTAKQFLIMLWWWLTLRLSSRWKWFFIFRKFIFRSKLFTTKRVAWIEAFILTLLLTCYIGKFTFFIYPGQQVFALSGIILWGVVSRLRSLWEKFLMDILCGIFPIFLEWSLLFAVKILISILSTDSLASNGLTDGFRNISKSSSHLCIRTISFRCASICFLSRLLWLVVLKLRHAFGMCIPLSLLLNLHMLGEISYFTLIFIVNCGGVRIFWQTYFEFRL